MTGYGRCTEHGRYACHVTKCREEKDAYGDRDNLGAVTPNTDGNISIGIGGGMAIDPTDGSLGMQVGGVTIDFN